MSLTVKVKLLTVFLQSPAWLAHRGSRTPFPAAPLPSSITPSLAHFTQAALFPNLGAFHSQFPLPGKALSQTSYS